MNRLKLFVPLTDEEKKRGAVTYSHYDWLEHCIRNDDECKRIYDEHTDREQCIKDIRNAWNIRQMA